MANFEGLFDSYSYEKCLEILEIILKIRSTKNC